MKNQLIFDTTNTPDSDSVGAYLRSADGTLLTHTDVGGKKSLDVNVASGINVEVDLSHVDDSVRLGDGTDFFTSTTVGGDIGLDVNIINASIVVSATNLDIRDLAFATDKVDVSGSSVSITGDVNVTQGTSPWVVSATNLDIRDLVAATDSVAAYMNDGAGNALTSTTVGPDVGLDVNIIGGTITTSDAALANTAILSAANTLAVAGTAEAVKASALANRKYLWIYNNGNDKMYIGGSGVTAANGFPILLGSYLELRAGSAVSPFFIGDTGKTPALRSLELS